MTASPLHRNVLATALITSVLAPLAVAQDDATRQERLEARRQELDRLYAFGPTAARELGRRITWQATVDGDIDRTYAVGPDVYVLDASKKLTRVDRETGNVIWTTTAADANDRVWGVTAGMAPIDGLPWGQNEGDRLYVTTDPVIFGIDHATGAIVDRQDLLQVPSTEVIRFQNYLIFGTRHGRITWHQYVVGQEWRSNQLSGPVMAQPTMVGTSRIAAASLGGTVLMLDARSTSRVWGDEVFDGVEAPLTEGGGMLFVASDDQYLWAFDADNGDVLWRYFTQSKLDTRPTYVVVRTPEGTEGRVLQWVESEGLVCLEADPGTSIEGKVIWKLDGIRGDAVGMNGDHVLFWEAKTRTLRVVDPLNGALVRTLELPQIRRIEMDGDTIFATGDGGRVVRLDRIG